MGRVFVKRVLILCALITVTYFLARQLNVYEKIRKNKLFFEYRESSIWPSSNSGAKKETAAIKNHQKLNAVLKDAPHLEDAVVPSEQLLQRSKCPVCFGTDLCNHVSSGALELDLSHKFLMPTKPRKISFPGALHTTNAVVAKTLVPSEFNVLDQHVCLKANEASDCDPSLAAMKILKKGNLLSVEGVQQIYKSVKKTRSDIPIVICTNDKMLSLLKRAFHEERGGDVTEKEQFMLYSTLASSPELVVLKFLTTYFPSLPFPQYYGSCGRIFVVEGGITPLTEYMNETFQIRAGLGKQVLQMVEDFIADEESEWVVMFTDFSLDNLGVNKDGEVVIIDIEDMVLVDKTMLKSQSISRNLNPTGSQKPCNVECLRRFTQQIMHSTKSSRACANLPHYSNLMYASICQKVLSYLDEHRVEDYFNADPQQESKPRSHPGLLHDVPSGYKNVLDELLQECVQESAPGGRIQAAEELKESLAEVFKDDIGDDDF